MKVLATLSILIALAFGLLFISKKYTSDRKHNDIVLSGEHVPWEREVKLIYPNGSEIIKAGSEIDVVWNYSEYATQWGNKINICLLAFDQNYKYISKKGEAEGSTCYYVDLTTRDGIFSFQLLETSVSASKTKVRIPKEIDKEFESKPKYFSIALVVVDQLPSENRSEWAGLIGYDQSDSLFIIK